MFPPTNSISGILQHMKRELHGLYKDEEIRSFWFVLLEEYCGLGRTRVLSEKERTISESEMLKVHFAIKELKKNKPIQYIIGKAWFCGLELIVDHNVLIPRPETEELVEWILTDYKDSIRKRLNIIDICTGSGCIAIALKKALPLAEVFAIDSSVEALHIVSKNETKYKCMLNTDLIDILDEENWGLATQFDIIVSNPPYVRMSEMKDMKANVVQYEPEEALFVTDEDPLIFYRAILSFASQNLVPGGSLYVEINEAMGEDTTKLAIANGFTNSIVRKDLSGKDRILRCRR